jgi:hypothetical protein
MPESHFSGHNLWLLKPSDMNRGRGIHIFDSIERLRKILKDLSSVHIEDSTYHLHQKPSKKESDGT